MVAMHLEMRAIGCGSAITDTGNPPENLSGRCIHDTHADRVETFDSKIRSFTSLCLLRHFFDCLTLKSHYFDHSHMDCFEFV